MPVLEPILPRQESKEERRLVVSKFDGQSFPDVTHWSVDKVVEFVESAGFLDQAQALKAEVICSRHGRLIVIIQKWYATLYIWIAVMVSLITSFFDFF